jgi:hypothetical protein
MELFSLIPVIGIASVWRRWQDMNSASALMHSVASIILVLFVGSLAGLLLPTTVLLMTAGTLLAALEGARLARQKNCVPVPIIIFLVVTVAYWLVHSGASFHYYDEYSHWGVYLREMLSQDSLWGAETNSMHPRYLPGTALWQYFFAVFSRSPEGAAYLAQFLLILSPLMVLWEKTNWQQLAWHIGIIVVVTVALSNFGHGYTSLYVDHVLGVWFVGVLLNFLYELPRRSALQLGSYLLPLMVIVLFKSTGFFFILACAGIMMLLFFVHENFSKAEKSVGDRLLRSALFPIATVVICIMLIGAWNMNRDAIGLADQVGSTGSLASRLLERESVFSEAEQAELSRRFLDVILHQQISKDELSAQFNAFSYPMMPLYEDRFRLTTVSLLGLSAIAMLLMWQYVIPPAYRVSWAIVGGGTWLTAVAYIGVLFLGYRYIANNRNGFELSSYIRYAHSMLLPVVLVCFAPLSPAFSADRVSRIRLGNNLTISRNAAIFAVALAALIFFEPPYLRPLYTVQDPPQMRTTMEPFTDRLRATIGEARLWVYLPNELPNGFIGQLLQFQLSPGRTYVEEDASALLDDPMALKDELRNWDYMWFALQSPEIDAAAEKLIGAEVSARVYRISVSDDDVQFEPVADAFGTGR